MPVVLATDPGERVLLYGSDGSALVVVKVDTSGRLLIAIPQERNPTKNTQLYAAAGVAPHTGTIRWTATIAAGKKAILESMHLEIYRDGAPTTPSRCSILFLYTPSGGTATRIIERTLLLTSVGDEISSDLSPHILMGAGDTLVAETYDLSVGGTLLLVAAATISVFDA